MSAIKEELISQIAALSSDDDSTLAAMEAKLKEGWFDKQQFVSCKELTHKLMANATRGHTKGLAKGGSMV